MLPGVQKETLSQSFMSIQLQMSKITPENQKGKIGQKRGFWALKRGLKVEIRKLGFVVRWVGPKYVLSKYFMKLGLLVAEIFADRQTDKQSNHVRKLYMWPFQAKAVTWVHLKIWIFPIFSLYTYWTMFSVSLKSFRWKTAPELVISRYCVQNTTFEKMTPKALDGLLGQSKSNEHSAIQLIFLLSQ